MFAQPKGLSPRESHDLGGFTLVELLVVIFIIGVLVALLLPAIQSAREAARRVQCKNHVKQLALAAITHEAQQGFFPSGGWGRAWVGDPDRSFGQGQPGNWAYSLLPFLEENAAYDLPKDGQPDVITEQQRRGAKQLIETPFEVFNCPSRRAPIAYPTDMGAPPGWRPPNTIVFELSSKLDYAINSGDHQWLGWQAGPLTIAEWSYEWCHGNTGDRRVAIDEVCSLPFSSLTGSFGYNGVSFAVSEVAIRHISDGSSNTYLIGEKYVDPQNYETNLDWGDNRAWCIGFDDNAFRTGFSPPLQDRRGYFDRRSFGSAHSAGIHMAFCDGSVRVLEYGIDQFVHMAAANRHDGTVHGLGHTELIPEPDRY